MNNFYFMKSIQLAMILILLNVSILNRSTASAAGNDLMQFSNQQESIESCFDSNSESQIEMQTIRKMAEFRDCTIKVKGENFDLYITFYDVSWWTCTKLKIGSWWKNL